MITNYDIQVSGSRCWRFHHTCNTTGCQNTESTVYILIATHTPVLTQLISTVLSDRCRTRSFLTGFRNGLLRRTLGPNEEKVVDKLNKSA